MIVRPATRDDDEGLVRLVERTPMDGPVRIACGCRPSFFGALSVEGGQPIVFVAEREGRLVGVGAATAREVYLNGEPTLVSYLGLLRVAPEARGTTALVRGYRQMAQELSAHQAAITITAIVSGNARAERVLAAGRAGLPAYRPLCDGVTYLLPADAPPPNERIEIGRGRDAAEIAGFLNELGPRRNFFPVCAAGDFDAVTGGRFPGLSPGDFLVARAGGGILGVLACRDVSRFRQTVVAGYAPWLRTVRPAVNAFCRLARRPVLPPAGTALRLSFGALCLVRDNDPVVLRALVRAARGEAKTRGQDWLVLTFDRLDPLRTALAGSPGRSLTSRIFSVHFAGHPAPRPPDNRPLHLESAML